MKKRCTIPAFHTRIVRKACQLFWKRGLPSSDIASITNIWARRQSEERPKGFLADKVILIGVGVVLTYVSLLPWFPYRRKGELVA